tara:strand:- start:9412 stop:9990 length:579 start_codon:yes stop_codon:yes gene_type:complete
MTLKCIKCHFCGGNHNCRFCPLEKKVAPQLKKIIGKKMEQYVSSLPCPCCRLRSLRLLNDNSPSLDIICTDNKCGKKFEVKSKCLSCKDLPDDLKINHGNYEYYLKRQEEGLDFIIVIYKVDRINKISTIRKVIHIPDIDIKKNSNFNVIQKNRYCNILIKDHTIYNGIEFKKNPPQLSFKNEIKNILALNY